MKTNSLLRPKLAIAFALAFAFLLFGLAPEMAFGALSCRGVFTNPDRAAVFGDINQEFKHELKFDVEVPNQSHVKDQCQLGTCHLQAWVSQMEHDYQVRTGKKIELSTKYLSAYHWMMRAVQELVKKTPGVSIELGATQYDSRALILRAGVMPEGVWEPIVDFTSEPTATRLQGYLKNVIVRSKEAQAKALNNAEVMAIQLASQHEIAEIFNNVLGHVPEKFEFEGKLYNPEGFRAEQFPDLGGYLMTVTVQDNPRLKVALQSDRSQAVIEGNINLVEKTARALIDKGENVYLAYEHVSEYVDNASGVMSMKAFVQPPNSGPVSRLKRHASGIAGGGHAVQIVGYSLDPKTGRVAKWKIKNSWGEKAGHDGYYTMYRDYFRQFVRNISYYSTSKIQLPSKLEKRDSFDPAI